MAKEENAKRYDLEERTEEFAKRVRAFIRTLPRTLTNVDDARQVGRSSGSIAANYIEANEAVSNKDRKLRIKIARKGAKESRLWLRLIYTGTDPAVEQESAALAQEATELMNIMSAILRKLGGDG